MAGPTTLHHHAYTAPRIAAERERTVSVCLPARNEAATIGPILESLLPLLDQGAVDQVVVVDDSTDGTAEIARGLGAEVHDQSALMPGFGPVDGKGDAMWRALSVLTGEVVCFLDADSEEVGEHYVCGLVGPLVNGGLERFAKAYYRRPFKVGDAVLPENGGRVTELLARPLLRRFYPELSELRQPLAGEIAAHRDLLASVPFRCGYGVDIALVIDVWWQVGIEGMAQVDLDVRQNRHRPLDELGPMADQVLDAVLSRLASEGRLGYEHATATGTAVERPPMREVHDERAPVSDPVAH